jgi:hypothetical protein
MFLFGGVYCTKFELILKAIPMKANRTRGARGDVKVFRTLDAKPHHRLASLGNTKKKKCSLLFLFSRGWIFLKWKGHFSFWGSAFQVFRQCGGASIRTRFCENYFLGVWIFAKPRLICFWVLSARRRGLGRNPRGLLDFVFGGLGFPILYNEMSGFELNYQFLFLFPFQFSHILNR